MGSHVAASYEFGRISAYMLHYVGRVLLARCLDIDNEGYGLFAVDYRTVHVGSHIGIAAHDVKYRRILGE